MIKIEIKNRFTGSIIFEFKKDKNTISETVKEYIRQEIEKGKSSADLRSADLRSADLRSADLRSADLRSADLRSADLSYADLSYADLRYADLRSADLRSADLRSAGLSYADLDKKYIQIACIGSRKGMTTYCYEDDIIWCGCYKGTLEEFEKKVSEAHKNNPRYLKEYIGAINYIKSLK
jgi:hypothetical protein